MADFRSLIQRSGKDSRISLGVGSSRPITDPNTGGGGNGRPSNPGRGGGGGPKGGNPSVPDNQVVALLHFEGTNGGTVFTNSASRGTTFVANGGGTTSTSQFKFGSSSLNVASSAGIVTNQNSDYTIGTDDFVFEYFIRPTSLALDFNSVKVYLDTRPNNLAVTAAPIIYSTTADGQLRVDISSVLTITGTVGDMTAATWKHVALCRANGFMRLFVDGTQTGSTVADATNMPLIGFALMSASNAAGGVIGFMDEFRFAHGSQAGIYTSNFSPPAAPFTP